MSEFKNLTLEVADGIAVLAISRPALPISTPYFYFFFS